MAPWLAIRVDASEKMGSGHLMRCLTLADAAAALGYRSVFLSAVMLPSLSTLILERGHQLVSLKADGATSNEYDHSSWLPGSEQGDAQASLAAIREITNANNQAPLWVVVDHYALAAPWETELQMSAPVLVIDDLSDRSHVARALLDQTFGKSASAYRDWVPADTTLMIGAKFALLRPEFHRKRSESLERRAKLTTIHNGLVTLGGVDNDNLTERVLEALAATELPMAVTVVAGASNPNKNRLVRQAQTSWPWVRVLEHTEDMAKLMVEADFCIGAAGSTSWERCVLGLPTLMLTLAANQRTIAQNLAQAGAALDFGELSPARQDALVQTIKNWLSAPESLKLMSERAAQVCDGLGTQRVLNKMGLDRE